MYKYSDSEAFRAKLFFLGGTVMCSPLCIELLAILRRESEFILWAILWDLAIFIIGFLMISFSYFIMEARDKKNADD